MNFEKDRGGHEDSWKILKRLESEQELEICMKLKKEKKDMIEKTTFLFDLDGVVMDTETGYTVFWNEMGEKYLGEKNFCACIKGQTLIQIREGHFKGMDSEFEEITRKLDTFENEMPYNFIPGADRFLEFLHGKEDVRTALVTSSNLKKMQNIYIKYPYFRNLFDVILTSENFKKSKPDPECFMTGMRLLGASPETTAVFEDSIHGLTASRKSGAFTIALATTNPADVITPLADIVIDNFESFVFLRKISPSLFE